MRQVINVGSFPNDISGELIESAFTKVDLMCKELHQAYVVPGRQAITPSSGLESIRSDFTKYNANLAALYAAKGLGTPPTVNVGAFLYDINSHTLRDAFTRVNTATSALYGAEGSPRAFFGAQGYGTQTRHAYAGGSSPQILHVTNRNDSGAGSLRAALMTTGPRIVVFDVSGYITLASRIDITEPYLWIAGQAGPSPGIAVRDYHISIRTHDVLIQHIRSRVGDVAAVTGNGEDAFNTTDNAYNVVFDHVSVAWAVDGAIDFASTTHDATASNCILSECLRFNTGSRAAILYDNVHRGAFLRCLFSHNGTRQPLFAGGSWGAAVNPLVYDQFAGWGTFLNDPNAAGTPIYASVVGGRWIAGPSADDLNVNLIGLGARSAVVAGSQLYRNDNSFTGARYTQLYLNECAWGDPSSGVTSAPSQAPLTGITVLPSSSVEAYVLANAGARPLDRDLTDIRLYNQVVSRTGHHLWTQADADDGGFQPLTASTAAFVPVANPHTVASNGYTNIENQIHALGVALVP